MPPRGGRLGGGLRVHQNVLFNSCRDSGDHGPFNSWDRQPFLTTVRDGAASLVPATNVISRNFAMANYAADGGCFDNDGPRPPAAAQRPWHFPQ